MKLLAMQAKVKFDSSQTTQGNCNIMKVSGITGQPED